MFWGLMQSRREHNILKIALGAKGACSSVGRAWSHGFFALKPEGLQPTGKVYTSPKVA